MADQRNTIDTIVLVIAIIAVSPLIIITLIAIGIGYPLYRLRVSLGLAKE